MHLLDILKKIFKIKPKPPRLYLKDICRGDSIYIEWEKIHGRIGKVVCMNNDQLTRKILLQVKWDNAKEMGTDEFETFIADYSDTRLKNLHLLNSYNYDLEGEENEVDSIEKLQEKIKEAISNEEYEKAREYQNIINKLTNK